MDALKAEVEFQLARLHMQSPRLADVQVVGPQGTAATQEYNVSEITRTAKYMAVR